MDITHHLQRSICRFIFKKLLQRFTYQQSRRIFCTANRWSNWWWYWLYRSWNKRRTSRSLRNKNSWWTRYFLQPNFWRFRSLHRDANITFCNTWNSRMVPFECRSWWWVIAIFLLFIWSRIKSSRSQFNWREKCCLWLRCRWIWCIRRAN